MMYEKIYKRCFVYIYIYIYIILEERGIILPYITGQRHNIKYQSRDPTQQTYQYIIIHYVSSSSSI